MTRQIKRTIPTILIYGALWGIFEATAGYALHLLPWRIGSFIWFPAAFFFMDRVYRATGKPWAVVAVAFISAAIKLLNLFTPIRPDYVLNPAISIVLEAMAMIGVLSIAAPSDKRAIGPIVAKVLAVNTLWRLMYTIYLILLVPAWMREVSVISNMETYLPFIFRENILSTIVCVIVIRVYDLIGSKASFAPLRHLRKGVLYAAAGILLCCSVLLQFVL